MASAKYQLLFCLFLTKANECYTLSWKLQEKGESGNKWNLISKDLNQYDYEVKANVSSAADLTLNMLLRYKVPRTSYWMSIDWKWELTTSDSLLLFKFGGSDVLKDRGGCVSTGEFTVAASPSVNSSIWRFGRDSSKFYVMRDGETVGKISRVSLSCLEDEEWDTMVGSYLKVVIERGGKIVPLYFRRVCSISEEADDKAVNSNSYNKTGGCIKCDEGTIHANEEGSTCIACSPGTYRSTGMIQCTTCPANTFSSEGAALCARCPDGTVSNHLHTSCTDCDAGTYRRRAFCLYRWFDMEECELCPENTYSFSGSAGCTNCSEGMFANDERVNCADCEAGTYRTIGMKECEPCPVNTDSPKGSASCSECPEGTFAKDPKANCANCEAGTFRTLNMVACEQCPENSYSPGGSASCTNCFGGTFNKDQRANCLDCEAGTYRSSNMSECGLCPVNTYSAEGSALCTNCPDGTFSNDQRTHCICATQNETHHNYGHYTWKEIIVGRWGEDPCFYDINDSKVARRRCSESGSFEDTDFTECSLLASKLMNEITSFFSENSTLSESAYVSKKIENVTKELEDTTEKSGSSLTSNEVEQSVDIIERILSLGARNIVPAEEPAALTEAANMTSPEAALDHPPLLSPIALKTIMSTMDNIQKNTKVEDLQLNKTNDRLKTAAVSISRKLIVVKQTDSNLIVQDSVGFGVAKVKKGIGDQDEKNILGLSGKNNVLKNSSLPSSQNEENVYFQAELETPESMIAAVVFYQSDDLFPSDSTMNIHLDTPAEQDDNNSRDLAQLLRRDHGSSELKTLSFVATIIADINIMDKITLQTNNSELKEDIALSFQVKDFATAVIDYTKRKTSVRHSLDCKFYNDSLRDWSEQGCKSTTVFNESRNKYEVLCECDHLTSFAVLMTFESESSETEDMVSLVLLALSLFCLVLTLSAIFFVRERREVLYSQVKLMLTTALILSITCFFLMDTFVSADSHADPSIPCSIIAFLLNYFWLCQISWMVLLAVTMYKALVKVFGIDMDHAFLKYCVIGWGVPIIFPTVGMAWGGRRFTDPKTCYIRHPYGLATFYGPLALGMLINWSVFFSIARVIFKAHETKAKKRRCSKIKLRQKQLKAALGVSTLLGLSWIVGFFLLMDNSNYSHISVVLRWLFILLNAPQGILIFLFGVVMDKKVRSFWIQKLTCGRYGGKNSTKTGFSVQSRAGGSYFIPVTATTTTSTPITGGITTNVQTALGQQKREKQTSITAEEGAGRSLRRQAVRGPRGRKVKIMTGMRRSLTNMALHIRRPTRRVVNQTVTE